MQLPIDEVSVTGTLRADAHVLYRAGDPPTGVLVFDIQPTKGLPYFIRQPIGTNRDHHITTEDQVKHMRKGVVVRAFGRGLVPQSDHGHAGLCLLGVNAVFFFPEDLQNGDRLPIAWQALPQEALA